MSNCKTILRALGAMSALVGVAAAGFGGETIYVDDDAPAGGDGQSWATAHRFFSDALTHAGGGGISEIRLGQGTYMPDRDEAHPGGTGNRARTFLLVDGAAVVGGYAGFGAGNPNERNVDLYPTILSGDLDGDGLIDDNNSYHVVTATATSGVCVVEGVHIQFGLAGGGVGRGAGLRHNGPSLTLRDCEFTQCVAQEGGALSSVGGHLSLIRCELYRNYASWWGGGLHVRMCDADIVECQFYENSYWYAAVEGGGIYAEDSNVTVTGCDFYGNVLDTGGGIYFDGEGKSLNVTDCLFEGNEGQGGYGGAIYHRDGASSITSCVFNENEADRNGGAIYRSHDGTFEASACTFTDNHGREGGGAISAAPVPELLDTRIVDCEFTGNDTGIGASNTGGAMVIGSGVVIGCTFVGNETRSGGAVRTQSDGHTVVLSDCVLTGNTVRDDGAAVYGDGGSLELVNCLVAGNESTGGSGGGVVLRGTAVRVVNSNIVFNIATHGSCGLVMEFNGQGSIEVENSILWGNRVGGTTGEQIQIWGDGAPVEVDYSCVKGLSGALGGVGNTGSDPLFLLPAGSDYRLTPGSPCIDAASNSAVPADRFDRNGNGDLLEPIPFDLAGSSRFVDDLATVDTGEGGPPVADMGAYEHPGFFVQSFCHSTPNSSGENARISATGQPSVVQNDFHLEAQGAVARQFGLFFYNTSPTQVAFGEGWLCVGSGAPGFFRLSPNVRTDASGSISNRLDFQLPPANAGPGAIQPGSTWYFQFYFRDPEGWLGTGFNLSDGLEVSFGL